MKFKTYKDLHSKAFEVEDNKIATNIIFLITVYSLMGLGIFLWSLEYTINLYLIFIFIISIFSALIINNLAKKGTFWLLQLFRYHPVNTSKIFIFHFICNTYTNKMLWIEKIILFSLLYLHAHSIVPAITIIFKIDLVFFTVLSLEYICLKFRKIHAVGVILKVLFLLTAITIHCLLFIVKIEIALSFDSIFLTSIIIISLIGLIFHHFIINYILYKENYKNQFRIINEFFLKLIKAIFFFLPNKLKVLANVTIIKSFRSYDFLSTLTYMTGFVILVISISNYYQINTSELNSLTISLICIIIYSSKVKFNGKLIELSNPDPFFFTDKEVSYTTDIIGGIYLVIVWFSLSVFYFFFNFVGIYQIIISFFALISYYLLTSCFIVTSNMKEKTRNKKSIVYLFFLIPISIIYESYLFLYSHLFILIIVVLLMATIIRRFITIRKNLVTAS